MLNFISKIHYSLRLAFLVLIGHFAYILNHHSYWDGLIYALFAETGEKTKFLLPWIENGRPVLGNMYWLLVDTIGLGGGLQAFVVICLWLGSVLTCAILRRANWLPEGLPLTAAAIVAVFPALHVHASFTTTFYVILLPLFLLSIRLRQAADSAEGIRFWIYSLVSVVSLMLSFFSEGLIAASVCIPGFVRFLSTGKLLGTSRKKTLWLDLSYFVLPVAYILAMPYLMPVSGEYHGSRNLSSSPSEILEYVGRYSEALMATPVFSVKLWVFVLATGAVGSFFIVNEIRRQRISAEKHRMICFFVLSAAFVLVAALPFILATRFPGAEGWFARHFTALIFPISILISSWIYLCLPERPYAQVFSFVVVAGLATSLVGYQFSWEARAAFDRSVRGKLAKTEIRDAGVIYFDKPVSSALSETYRIYEWNVLIFDALGDLKRILVSSPDPMETPEFDPGVVVQMAHALVDDDWKLRRTCIGNLLIRPAKELTWHLGLRYVYSRFIGRQNMESWIDDLSEVTYRSSGVCPTPR